MHEHCCCCKYLITARKHNHHPSLALLIKSAEFPIITVSSALLKGRNLFKKKMQKWAAEGLIRLIGAASVKCVADPQGAGPWVGSKHPGRLKKHRGRLLTVPNLIRGLVRGGVLQCSLLECASTKTLEGLWSLLVRCSHVRPRVYLYQSTVLTLIILPQPAGWSSWSGHRELCSGV